MMMKRFRLISILTLALLLFQSNNREEHVFIPNLFTPNGDGNNDFFVVYGEGFESLELKIYNRWGVLVFYSRDVEEITTTGWDGTYNGTPQTAGTYLWKLNGQFISGSEVLVDGKNSGSLVLLQ